MKILVVEDEAPTAAFLRKGLSEEGFVVDTAADAASADEAVSVNEYDAILLDVMLPGGNGFDLCQAWRRRGIGAPIVFLTARDEVQDRVRGLQQGGDDYLVKPFAFEELLARLHACLRRATVPPRLEPYACGDLTLDPATREVRLHGAPLELTAREYLLLEHLIRNAGRVVSRTELWEHVWESGAEPQSNVVDVYIGYLRHRLKDARHLLRTVRGAGYVLG